MNIFNQSCPPWVGYIEEALKCYDHDVERTIEALRMVLSSSSEGGGGGGGTIHNNDDDSMLHPRLLTLLLNLPRKLHERVSRHSANVNLHRGMRPKEDWTEFAKIQKERIKFVECMAEKETRLVDNLSLNVGRPVVSDEEEEAVADSHDRQHFLCHCMISMTTSMTINTMVWAMPEELQGG